MKREGSIVSEFLERCANEFVNIAKNPRQLFVAALILTISIILLSSTHVKHEHSELAKSLGWPVLICIMVVAFRKPLESLLYALPDRITKFKAFSFEIELASAKARGTANPEFGDLKTATAVDIHESGTQLFRQMKDRSRVDYVVIDLGAGKEWITSRLFVVATMFQRLRGVQCIVFLEGIGEHYGTLVGIAQPQAVRWCLSQNFPWLENKFTEALAAVFSPGSMAPNIELPYSHHSPAILNWEGAVEPDVATSIGKFFLHQLQTSNPPPLELP